MRLCLGFGGVETGAFEHYIDADFFPGEVCGVLFGVDLDLLAVDDDCALFCFDLIGESVLALRAVVLQKVSEHLGIGEVVDGDDFVACGAEHLAESKTADSAEAVDSNSDIFHNESSKKVIFRKGSVAPHRYILHNP